MLELSEKRKYITTMYDLLSSIIAINDSGVYEAGITTTARDTEVMVTQTGRISYRGILVFESENFSETASIILNNLKSYL